ncbi:MAG TPA: hypothetical protein VFS08_08495 [Gemmatimonadaceae bacterium]|nr:hypothetical protein [Gemmatimonadaceae bacterium]
MRHLTVACSLALIVAACDRPSSDAADTTVVDSTVASAPADTGPSVPAPDADAWTARPDGIGPIRVGMTSAEARAAAGLAPGSPVPGDCAYLNAGAEADALPHGVRVMLARDTVVRLETRDSTVATAEGVRVGDPEARVTQRYEGRVEVQLRKYEPPPAHLLVVTPPDDSLHRVMLLTDGTRVTELRVGRMPEVALVEGCG